MLQKGFHLIAHGFCRQENHWNTAHDVQCAQPRQRLRTAQLGHHDIEQHELGLKCGHLVERFKAAWTQAQFVAAQALQAELQDHSDVRVVFHAHHTLELIHVISHRLLPRWIAGR